MTNAELLKSIEITIDCRLAFNFIDALPLIKTKYEGDKDEAFLDMEKDFISKFPEDVADILRDFLFEIWNSIEPLKYEDLVNPKGRLGNLVDSVVNRQLLFTFIPATKLFADAEIMDEKIELSKQINFLRIAEKYGIDFDRFWENIDALRNFEAAFANEEIPEEFFDMIENKYQLIRKPSKGFLEDTSRVPYLFAVRVFCTSTNKEYIIRVDHDADYCKKGKYDALAAVAWTVRCPITNPKAILRQGDQFAAIKSPNSVILPVDEHWHLNGKQYLDLLIYQS